MASEGPKSLAPVLFFINLIMYIVTAAIAGWAINYGIDETAHAVVGLPLPAQLFPIYYPIGNMATGFYVIFSLITGVVGSATSLAGLQEVLQWNPATIFSAAAFSVINLALSLLTMGLACKQISISWTPPILRTMEALTFILSGTQLLCTGIVTSAAIRPIQYTDRRWEA